MRLMRVGQRSGEVADVQSRLRALGLPIVDEPGYFGESTRDAVRTFQQTRHILVDGIVGANTWSELVEASWKLGDRTLYLRGPLMRGDDIRTLQRRLNALGFDAGREDGIFGQETAAAVREFQREYGVHEDGIWGRTSLAALEGLRVDRPGTPSRIREQLRRPVRADLRNVTVVVDPGHDPVDRGETGRAGVVEADVVWDIAERAAHLLSSAGAHVRFTRTEAEGPDASGRAQRANEAGADAFVSIHLNSHEEPNAEGASTYYFGSSSAGERLAEMILDELVALGQSNCRAHPRSYTVLRETRMPAVLVEPSFISSPNEEKRLDDPAFRQGIAAAIVAGLARYFRGES